MNIFACVSLRKIGFRVRAECNWRSVGLRPLRLGKRSFLFLPMGNFDIFDDDGKVLANVHLLGAQSVQHFRQKARS